MPTGEEDAVAQVTVSLSEVEELRLRAQTAETERTTAQEALQTAQQEVRQYASIIGTIRVNLGYGEDVSDEQLAPKVTEIYAQLQRLGEMLGNNISIEVAVAELLSFKQETAQREAERRLDGVVTSFTENWHVTSEDNKAKIAKLHKSFKRALQVETLVEGETLETMAARVWEEDFQTMADSILQAMGGPAAVVTSINQQETDKKGRSDADLKNARRFLPGK